jgi:hypothetical protein
MTKEIQLTGKHSNLVMLVDDDDYETLVEYKWHGSVDKNNIYARTNKQYDGKWKTVRAHQLIMGTYGKGHTVQIDHLNSNGLDNRKENLKLVSNRGNQHNRRDQNKFVGVYKRDNKWQLRFGYNGKHILPRFPTPEMAGWYYDTLCKAIEMEPPNKVEITPEQQQEVYDIVNKYVIKRSRPSRYKP